ncbi:MAG: hypothetical protein K8H75_16040 [Sulfuricella sp.]|nr:hypothetical protein [Sulfuricella sp.]
MNRLIDAVRLVVVSPEMLMALIPFGIYAYPSTSLRAGSEQLALTPALSQRERGKLGEMADERSRPPYNQPSPVLAGYDWPSLVKKDGDELFDHYRHTLEKLGSPKGLLSLIFNKSQNKFQDPAKLRRVRYNAGTAWRPME